ncbi:TolC family protein [Joostella atrarenae]|uniref:TolC family protein n=1 Tax=Joostella atrarenae TaxID=679257 RepID=A0ABS9J6N1_9FLAO|nr:TolC family protein [Joostella atrarenae]MCF8716096.1 TolC family protein [Joostella atrarenae]
MRIKIILICLLGIIGIKSMEAQETSLSLEEAIKLALINSDESKIADTKVNTAEYEVKVAKSKRYPDLKIAGQYQHLTKVNADIQFDTGGQQTGAAEPDISSIMFGQATASVPVFTGFELNNLVKASQNNYEAATLDAKSEKEDIALQTVNAYVNLYKANKTVSLIEENLKSAQQRVKDFSAMEENGLLARNDLLKAQLQESNIEVSLEEAKKNEKILNYSLVTTLKMPEDTKINIEDTNFQLTLGSEINDSIQRSDLKALEYRKEAAKNNIKIAQSKYYPDVALMSGYAAFDIKNALTITDAMNFGVGVSYNLADIFKAKSDVKVAKSQAEELQHTIDMVQDKIKIQIEDANQNYNLANRKYDVYIKSEEQAIENYRIVKDKYDNGLVDTNDLLEADIDQLQAKINLAYAKADIIQNYYKLLNAQGQINTDIQ